jgi:6-pyruvoyltetrahydropterin/6-carboxytetrahydropterin synthase
MLFAAHGRPMKARRDDQMNMISVKVRQTFSAGHRILGLSGAGEKCRNIHGHNFECWWTFGQTSEWPPRVEFGAVKAELKSMIDGLFDHAFIVHIDDEFLDYLTQHDLKRYPLRDRPTTEAIAAEIARLTQQTVPELDLVCVQLAEGSNNEAVCMVKDRGLMFPDDLRVERVTASV